ncbi:hypothetical protein AB0E69_00215 [Kribbella sp. NPDC026611]|uniref:hypothetical protein n=1 Tax=Kribbella sp. NPDC026611 TaxID=3154911 RepID=UPI0034106820
MRHVPSQQVDGEPSTRPARRWWIGAGLVLAAAATTGVILVQQHQSSGGAPTADAVAHDALNALAKKDQDALVQTSNAQLSGREAAAQQLVDRCRTSDFAAASVAVRGGFGDDVAWADVTVPKGAGNCRSLTLTLSRVDGGWYVALGAANVPSTRPTASTER